MQTGILFVIAAASGTGKTTLAKALLKQDLNLAASVSYTTRPKRDDEQDGKSYHFVSETEFLALEQQGVFIESATVYGYRYATAKTAIDDIRAKGKDVLLVLDWQGVSALKRNSDHVVSVFLLPPSVEALTHRLTQRGDPVDSKHSRQETFFEDLQHCKDCDYLVINDQFTKAVQEVMAIIDAERLRTSRQAVRMTSLIGSLLDEVRK